MSSAACNTGPVGCLKVCHGWYGRPTLCCLYVTFGYPRLECLKEWCWLLEVMPCIFRGQFICLTSSSVMKAICRIALRRCDLCWCATSSETASCNPHAAHMTKVLRSRRCLKALGCPEENWTDKIWQNGENEAETFSKMLSLWYIMIYYSMRMSKIN